MTLIFEKDVAEAVIKYLEDHGYEIEQALGAMSKGIDIIAVGGEDSGKTVYVEVRGETSAKESSSRLG